MIIDNLNIVLKGQWKIKGNKEDQDFIYKKTMSDVNSSQNEYMLKELFFEQKSSEFIDPMIGIERKNRMDLSDPQLMLTKLFQSQGQHEGFFNYNGT